MTYPGHAAAAALAVRGVQLSRTRGGAERAAVNLDVKAGELAMLGVFDLSQGNAVADLVSGMTAPESGTISALGQDWNRLDYNSANGLRGRIGRLLTRGRWIEGYSVLENILLQQLHNSRISRDDLLVQATALAHRFALPGIPSTDARDMLAADLQRAGCVRAFLGNPALILLEEPTLSVDDSILPPLVNTCLEAMYRGAAILWITARQDLVHDPKIPASLRLVASGGRVTAVTT